MMDRIAPVIANVIARSGGLPLHPRDIFRQKMEAA